MYESHFYGIDLTEISEKFYVGKNRDRVIIWKVELMPET